MTEPRARYRAIRLAVLAVALLAGIGYPLVLALGGSALVDVHPGARGATIAIHNARPWLLVAAVAALLLVADLVTARRRPGVSDPPAEGVAGRLRLQLAGARHDNDRLRAGRRSEREWNAAVDAHLAQAPDGSRDADLARFLLELTMELVDAPAGLLMLPAAPGEGPLSLVAARGVDEPAALAARLAAMRPEDGVGVVDDVLVVPVPGGPAGRGLIALTGREGGIHGLDEEVLAAIGRRAGLLLAG